MPTATLHSWPHHIQMAIFPLCFLFSTLFSFLLTPVYVLEWKGTVVMSSHTQNQSKGHCPVGAMPPVKNKLTLIYINICIHWMLNFFFLLSNWCFDPSMLYTVWCVIYLLVNDSIVMASLVHAEVNKYRMHKKKVRSSLPFWWYVP